MRCVVAFFDNTLGGTSRSALESGKIWKSIGYEVNFLPLQGVHIDRRSEFDAVGRVITSLSQFGTNDVLHLHHGAWSTEIRNRCGAVLSELRYVGNPGLVLTNNIFAANDRWLHRVHSAPMKTGVLGVWAAAQYAGNMGWRGPAAFVIPNAQPIDRFAHARGIFQADSRLALGLPSEGRIAIRMGSPINGKWSQSYVKAARDMPQIIWVLIGAPAQLQVQLQNQRNVIFRNRVADDQTLLQYYRSADVFAHDAQRGESFGNVILEALACGVPVAYRERPFRDNTPWEFQSLSGFKAARSYRSWLRTLQTLIEHEVEVEVPWAYGQTAVVERLREVLGGADPGSPSLSKLDRIRVAVTHNPVTARLRAIRLALRSSQAERKQKRP